VAEEVLAAVTFSPEEWQALSEQERRKVFERPPGDALAEEADDLSPEGE
jgi:hypothetical protein